MLLKHQQGNTPHFSCLTIFTTALCNLNCSYCYICKDKNGGLKKIDDDIEKAFETGEYIKSVLDLDPGCKDSINEISLWGGEPFLGIYRFIDHLNDFFRNFPNIRTIDVSSNFALPDHSKRILDFINAVDKNYYLLNPSTKKFKLSIQISVDGYEEMNDVTRGAGSTQSICKNWREIVNNLQYDNDRYEIEFFTKTTLSRSSWHFLDNKEKVLKWCEFFDKELYQPWKEAKCKALYRHGLWNNAAPTEWTQKDGLEYAKISKLFQEAFPEIKEKFPSFKDFPTIIPEALLAIDTISGQFHNDMKDFEKSLKCKKCGMGCGVFSYNLVPIPNGKFTMCHRGLFDAYTDYVNNLEKQDHMHDLAGLWTTIDTRSWVLNKENILMMHKTINKLYEYHHQIFETDVIQQIKTYADSGLIDPQYQNINNIYPTLGFFLLTSQCIQDCFIFGGSWTTRTPLEIPLMYNGVMQVVKEEIDRVIKERGEALYEDL